MKNFLKTSAIIAAACFASAAHASIVFSIERTSDTTAVLTATGSLDAGISAPLNGNEHFLTFQNPYGNALSTYQNDGALQSSTLTAGGQIIDFSYTVGPGYNFSGVGTQGLYMGNSNFNTLFSNGQTVTGSAYLSLPDGDIFADVGSSGNVYWGTGPADAIGSYQIVDPNAVPEPTTVALLGLGLMGVAVSRRKSAKK
ncbi:PEP-CTERM sorting domain-containing protein [Noviherbaspirillum pedocola]|uniref:PEP-CTERM sorting domain-containing protein n=1 Tax=Noviherbaspirillum pedocola TaxID=2801341 RepID=A0A934SVF8_9BURK|nr:PEP-CTERM sorting domain-containing protein [Noviherbaspirillum pedocola]MBK4736324.1 PEP-CTERM sorting domain-containing protein [Noviherbaspirillum pedocola]